MAEVEIPEWIAEAENLASQLETSFNDVQLLLSLAGTSAGSTVVDLAIAGGWKGKGANAAENAVARVSSKFTHLSLSYVLAADHSSTYGTEMSKIANRLETLKKAHSSKQGQIDDMDDRQYYSKDMGDPVGYNRAKGELRAIEEDIREEVAKAIVCDYEYAQSISERLDDVARVLRGMEAPRQLINIDGAPFESVFIDNGIDPFGPDCPARDDDERLTHVGTMEPPWEDEDDSDGLLDWLQGLLDVGGLIPGLGEFADFINALISGGRAIFDPEDREEHLMNMGLSLGAMIPIAGWGSTAYKARKLKKLGVDDDTTTAFRTRYKTDDLPDGFKVEDGKIVDPNGNWFNPKTGRWHGPNGGFTKDPLKDVDDLRVNPSRETRQKAYENQRRNENGELVDSNGNVVDSRGDMDLGHKPGFENWRLRDKYKNGEITLDEWKKIADDPDIYEYQDRSINRSHRDELKTPDSPSLDKYLRDNGYID